LHEKSNEEWAMFEGIEFNPKKREEV